MSADNSMPDFTAILNGAAEQSPAQVGAALAEQTGQPIPATAAADPDQQDPQTITDPAYAEIEMEPDSAVTDPADAQPAATAEPEPTPDPTPAVTNEPPPDLTETFQSIADEYNGVISQIEQTQNEFADVKAKLDELQGNAEGIVEFTPEIRALTEKSAQLSARLEVLASKEQEAFTNAGDDAIIAVTKAYPELNDDSHPATISMKQLLESNPELATKSPTAVANLAESIAKKMRATVKQSAVPASQPKPAPGPVPAKAALPSSAMASAAQAQRPAPGQPSEPSLVTRIAQSAASMDSLGAMFDSVLGKAETRIRIS